MGWLLYKKCHMSLNLSSFCWCWFPRVMLMTSSLLATSEVAKSETILTCLLSHMLLAIPELPSRTVTLRAIQGKQISLWLPSATRPLSNHYFDFPPLRLTQKVLAILSLSIHLHDPISRLPLLTYLSLKPLPKKRKTTKDHETMTNHLTTAPEEPLPAYSTCPSSFDQPRALEEARERATTPSTERIAPPLPVHHGRLTIREVASERSSLSHAPFYNRPRARWTPRSGRKKSMFSTGEFCVKWATTVMRHLLIWGFIISL